jgi:flagellar basal body P-ring protein FlgI
VTRRTTNDSAFGGLRFLAAAVVLCGCSGPILRPQSPEARVDMPLMPDVKYVSEFTHPYGMNYVQIESVSLVTGLPGTGSDPPPTPQRAALLDEMKRHDVANPNEVLASGTTSMVLARAFLRPGIQEGDRFDVEVRIPSQSETKSIRNGWLLQSRLTEMAVLGQAIREGHVLGIAEGAVLVDPSADAKKDPALATRGRILGGGIVIKSRPLGLVINHEHESVRASQDISHSINHRFFTFVDGRKQGVATPKTSDFIDVVIHPRYKENVARYMQVLRNVSINESPTTLQSRLIFLEQQLSDPLTSASAAIRLEAIGDDQAKEVLRHGLATNDLESKFYAAEALAYLDETSAVGLLAQVARDEPAFRVNALAALSAMDDATAHDALGSLLEAKSAETRYGAFRSLWAMNHHDPLLHDENLNSQFHYHVLDVPGPDMVHVTQSHLPEIVLFGKEQTLKLPLMLDAGKTILVNGMNGDKITVSHFAPGSEPKQQVVSTKVDDVIRAIVSLGGTYPDVVQALQQAKADGALQGRFEVDALPQAGRQYDHGEQSLNADAGKPADAEGGSEKTIEVATPLPELFGRQK